MATTLTMTDVAGIALASTIVSGGATVSLKGDPAPTSGYGVAVHGLGRPINYDSPDLLGKITEYVEGNGYYLTDTSAYLGTWVDTKTGILWLDVTLVSQDREGALNMARETGEIAVWDFAAQDEIRV